MKLSINRATAHRVLSKTFCSVMIALAIVCFASCEQENEDENNNNSGGGGGTTNVGVIINGVRWATSNVDVPGTFAENPEDAGMFYQWNRKIGWSSALPMINSNGETTWDNSWPSGDSWEKANDPCPEGWRVPTLAELESLSNAGSVWTTQNGVTGRKFGSGSNTLFLPAAGYVFGEDEGFGIDYLTDKNIVGYYWSSTVCPPCDSYDLYFDSEEIGLDGKHHDRTLGLSVRCVAEQEGGGGATIKVESVELNVSELTLKVGESQTLTAQVYPPDAEYSAVKWESSNSNVATVTQSGKVTAIAKGTATITASAGGKYAECEVTVSGSDKDDDEAPDSLVGTTWVFRENGGSLTLSFEEGGKGSSTERWDDDEYSYDFTYTYKKPTVTIDIDGDKTTGTVSGNKMTFTDEGDTIVLTKQ